MASSFEVTDCLRQISEHAHALWIEATTLIPLAKEDPTVILHPVVLLANKSAEVCRLARTIDKMVSSGQATVRHPNVAEALIQEGRRAKTGRT